jgi:hypothetical protein
MTVQYDDKFINQTCLEVKLQIYRSIRDNRIIKIHKIASEIDMTLTMMKWKRAYSVVCLEVGRIPNTVQCIKRSMSASITWLGTIGLYYFINKAICFVLFNATVVGLNNEKDAWRHTFIFNLNLISENNSVLEIWCSQGGKMSRSSSGLWGCDDVWTCKWVPTFRRNIPPPFQGVTTQKTTGSECREFDPKHRQQYQNSRNNI